MGEYEYETEMERPEISSVSSLAASVSSILAKRKNSVDGGASSSKSAFDGFDFGDVNEDGMDEVWLRSAKWC